jgi:hypothetical protein
MAPGVADRGRRTDLALGRRGPQAMTMPETPETTEAMVARVRDSLDRQGRGEAFADHPERPFAAMQATMTALYDRPGISG